MRELALWLIILGVISMFAAIAIIMHGVHQRTKHEKNVAQRTKLRLQKESDAYGSDLFDRVERYRHDFD